jgi:SPP1 gp7 family putative phage head morphogenesis protein
MSSAFAVARHAVKQSALHAAIVAKSQPEAEAAVSPALVALRDQLHKKLPPVLAKIVQAGGDAAAKNLVHMKLLRSAARPAIKLDYRLDVNNEKASEYVKQHALELVKGLSKTTEDDLRDAILSAFEEDRAVVDIVKDIIEIIDDPNRAEVIARTETMTAANEGQSLLWDQAVEDGLLTGKEQQVWIVTPDDRLCPICEPMDGEQVGLDEAFDVDGEEIDGPPAHPNCRCTTGLVL